MGFGSFLGKIIGPIAGAAAAPFTGGASLMPFLIGTGVQAGTSLLGAKMSSGAAKQAAEAQIQGAREAQDFLRQDAFQTRNKLDELWAYGAPLSQPYGAAGQGAAGTLQRLLTPGMAYAPGEASTPPFGGPMRRGPMGLMGPYSPMGMPPRGPIPMGPYPGMPPGMGGLPPPYQGGFGNVPPGPMGGPQMGLGGPYGGPPMGIPPRRPFPPLGPMGGAAGPMRRPAYY